MDPIITSALIGAGASAAAGAGSAIASGKIKKIGRKYLILHIEQMGITVCVKQNQVIRKESALK